MPVTKKTKLVDVLIVGTGIYVDVIAQLCKYQQKTAEVILDETGESVRSIAPGIFTCGGRRFAASRVVYSVRPPSVSPLLVGLTKTPHFVSTMELLEKNKKPGQVIIVAGHDQAFSDALQLAERGYGVDIVTPEHRPLIDFDQSVSDYLRQMMKRVKVRSIESTTALSTIQTASGIYLVAEQNGAPRRMKGNYLVVEPHQGHAVALTSASGSSDAPAVHYEKNAVYIDSRQYVSLGDLVQTLGILNAGRYAKKRSYAHVVSKHFQHDGLHFLSIGSTETQLMAAHTAYNKSVVVIAEAGKQVGFIKLLTRYTGKLLGISCVHTDAASFMPLWYEAVHGRKDADTLLKNMSPEHPIARAYLQAVIELAQ